MHPTHVPLRVVTGAYILNSGLSNVATRSPFGAEACQTPTKVSEADDGTGVFLS